MSSFLKNNMTMWLKYDEKIKNYQKELAILREKKSKIDSSVIRYMNNKNMHDKILKCSNKRIKFTSSSTSENVTKKYIIKQIKQFYKNDEKTANELIDKIYKNRPKNKKMILKIIK